MRFWKSGNAAAEGESPAKLLSKATTETNDRSQLKVYAGYDGGYASCEMSEPGPPLVFPLLESSILVFSPRLRHPSHYR